MAPEPKTILLCGGGNAVHVMAALFGSQGHKVRILSTWSDEAARLRAASEEKGITVKCDNGQELVGWPEVIGKDPAVVVPGCDIVILALPAFAHEGYLKVIEPYVNKTLTVGAFPGQGGFDTCVRSCLGDKGDDCVVFAGETLPWACRTVEFGKKVEILGTKKEIDVAVSPASKSRPTLELLQTLLGKEPKLVSVGSFLSITLMNINMIWHPTISYGRYRLWDNETPFEKPPPFYEGVDAFTADLLSQMSDEMLRVKEVINASYPDVDLAGVMHVTDWINRAYGEDVKDNTNLMTAINTNKGYRGLVHPCVPTNDGKFLPDFKYRYFSEDVPFGLVVAKGIAELCDLPTPGIDTVIAWCQDKLNRTFIRPTNDHYTLRGSPDLDKSRAPQRYGFTDLHTYMVAHKYA